MSSARSTCSCSTVFWEAMLISDVSDHRRLGGEGRVYAAFKSSLHAGRQHPLPARRHRALFSRGGETFDILALTAQDLPSAFSPGCFSPSWVAFAVKVPMVPVHTWLPDAHVQAPTAGSIILAGVLLKMGALRVPALLAADAAGSIALLLDAYARAFGPCDRLWRLAGAGSGRSEKAGGYSSISHMGFVTLGFSRWKSARARGQHPADVQPRDNDWRIVPVRGPDLRAHAYPSIANYGGLMKAAPVYTAFLALFTLSSMALPGTNAFVGELLVLSGGFAANLAAGAAAVVVPC